MAAWFDRQDFAPFVKIGCGKVVQNVLQERLPYSALVYNMMRYEDIPNSDMRIHWFTLNGHAGNDCWIVAAYYREEKFYQYMFCPPASPDELGSKALVLEDFKQAISKSSLIKWDSNYYISGNYLPIVPILMEVSMTKSLKPVITEAFVQYWMTSETVKSLDCKAVVSDLILKPLDITLGAQLLSNTWKYTLPGSYEHMVKQILKLPSAGAYINNEPVSGIISKRHGALGVLYTHPDHRNKGYGGLVTKYLAHRWTELGLVPCIHVDADSDKSKEYYEKLGFIKSHDIVFIYS